MNEKYMANESDETKGENIHKPYEPDIIKGLTASSTSKTYTSASKTE